MATRVEKTVGPGKDYANFGAFLAGEKRNLVTADEHAVAKLYPMIDGSAVAITLASGWVCDTDHRIILESVNDTGGIRDDTGVGHYFWKNLTPGAYFDIDKNIWIDIEGGQYANWAVGVSLFRFTDGGVALNDRAYLHMNKVLCTGSGKNIFQNNPGKYSMVYCRDCALIGWEAVNGNVGYFEAYQCACRVGGAFPCFADGLNNHKIKNCYAHSVGGTAIAGTVTLAVTTCATSDASSPDAGLRNIPYNDATFVKASTNSDWHLLGATALIDGGTDLSGDPNPFFADVTDINGNAFGSAGGGWDIGYHELGGSPPVPPGTIGRIDNAELCTQLCYEGTNETLQAKAVAATATGSLQDLNQILGNVYDETNNWFRVVDVAGPASANHSRLSIQQIFQDVHDPTSQAIRVIQGVAAAGSGSRLSAHEILNWCHDPTNHALRVSPQAVGATFGRRLSFEQILQRIYDPGVGIRMDVQ